VPTLSQHARDQMKRRKITEEDVRLALSRRVGHPDVGTNGNLKVFGYAKHGRILKLVLTPDQKTIITLAWPDE
jgi:Domain of unknown function (DUF4258)